MAIWTVAHSKGGVGKSTVAINLAVAAARDGKRVLLIDADPQGSSIAWRAIRETDDVAALSITTATLHKDVPGLAAGYDLIIIDCGGGLYAPGHKGQDSQVYRSAVIAADLVVIPALASQVDLYAASDVVELIRYASDFKPNLRAVWVLNQIVAGTKLGQEIRDALAEYAGDVTLCESQLTARNAYRNAYGNGAGVLELVGKEKDPKAIQEINSLYAELLTITATGGK